MVDIDKESHKFLRGVWFSYELDNWEIPHSLHEAYSLLQFIGFVF